jgi:hypothetical protein
MGQRAARRRRLQRACLLLMAAGLAGLLTGCGSAAPLVTESEQAGMSTCTPAPNPIAGIGISRWSSPVGVAVGMYYNQSSASVTVQTVSLVAEHNMVLHGAMVYEMARYRNPLPNMFQWEYGSSGLKVNAKLVQQVPGAVIGAGIGPVTDLPKQQPNVYEVAIDVTARQPGAAWAAGVNVGYTANGQAHEIRLLIGFAIGAYSRPGAYLHPTGPADDPLCETATQAIESAWASAQQGS